MQRPLVIAHRGASRECPENTLPAFLRALELGVDGIELDVHLTRDKVVVVHHDAVPRVLSPPQRLAGRGISDLSLTDVRQLHVDENTGIPTLQEVLAAIGDRAEVFIEIKGLHMEREVVACAGQYGKRFAIHSFDHRAVKRVRKLAPEFRTGVLLSSYLIETDAALTAAGALDCWQQWELVDEQLVADVHSVGGRVIAWTINNRDRALELGRIRVDGLCSDVPDQMHGIPRLATGEHDAV